MVSGEGPNDHLCCGGNTALIVVLFDDIIGIANGLDHTIDHIPGHLAPEGVAGGVGGIIPCRERPAGSGAVRTVVHAAAAEPVGFDVSVGVAGNRVRVEVQVLRHGHIHDLAPVGSVVRICGAVLVLKLRGNRGDKGFGR